MSHDPQILTLPGPSNFRAHMRVLADEALIDPLRRNLARTPGATHVITVAAPCPAKAGMTVTYGDRKMAVLHAYDPYEILFVDTTGMDSAAKRTAIARSNAQKGYWVKILVRDIEE